MINKTKNSGYLLIKKRNGFTRKYKKNTGGYGFNY